MPFNLVDLMERRVEKFALFERHLNAQLVHVLRTIGFDADYVRAEGAYLYDEQGTRYLDLLSGFGVFAVGRNHPAVVGALQQVLEAKLAGLVQLDVSLLSGLLAERLVARMPGLDKVFFCNSGAEAVEAAIKFSRSATRRSKIAYCDHAFHGLTYGALSLNGDEHFRKGFDPFVGECVRIPFNDVPALERVLAGGDIAAFIFEPIQGKGVNVPSDEYLVAAQRLCRKHHTLLVADEIQTGMGRTGRFLACEHWQVEPDVVLLAKALSGGFAPVGAVAMRSWIFDKMFDRMDRAVVHGSTFAKNDLAMAAGLATLMVLDEERLIERAATMGQRLMEGLGRRLSGSEFVKDIRGKAMMIGIEFGSPSSLRLKAAYTLLERADRALFCQLLLMPLFQRHHILAQVAGPSMPVIKLLPPFVINEQDVTWIETAIADVVTEAHNLGAMWDTSRTLIRHALKARASVS